MSEICHFVPVDCIEHKLYTQLEALELWSMAGVEVPALVLKQLTMPCQLVQNVLFRNCDVLTDQLLTELWAVRLVSQPISMVYKKKKRKEMYLIKQQNKMIMSDLLECHGN